MGHLASFIVVYIVGGSVLITGFALLLIGIVLVVDHSDVTSWVIFSLGFVLIFIGSVVVAIGHRMKLKYKLNQTQSASVYVSKVQYIQQTRPISLEIVSRTQRYGRAYSVPVTTAYTGNTFVESSLSTPVVLFKLPQFEELTQQIDSSIRTERCFGIASRPTPAGCGQKTQGFAVFAYNTAKQESTKFSSFYLMYGHKLNLLIDSAINFTPSCYIIDIDDYANDVQRLFTTTWLLAQRNILKAQCSQQKQYNKKAKDVEFKIDDLVYKQTTAIKPGSNINLSTGFKHCNDGFYLFLDFGLCTFHGLIDFLWTVFLQLEPTYFRSINDFHSAFLSNISL